MNELKNECPRLHLGDGKAQGYVLRIIPLKVKILVAQIFLYVQVHCISYIKH